MHYIKTSALRTLVLDAIKRVSGFVRLNEDEFVRLVREASEIQSAEMAKARKAELDAIIKRLYEDKVTGSLSAKRFDTLSREYEDEQNELDEQISKLQTGLDRFSEDGEKAGKFIGIVRKYTDFTELTPAMLNEFVDKIIVHEAEGELNLQLITTFLAPENVIKQQHNCQATGYWKTNSVKYNFLLLAHEYLFVWEK
jgi:hypothetical protein